MDEGEKQLDPRCRQFRLAFDGLAAGVETGDAFGSDLRETHALECPSCAAWKSQTEQLLDLTACMAQFDVSEALTQKILSSVESDRRVSGAFDRAPWLPLGAFGTLALALACSESVEGVTAWLAGMLGLALLELLLSSSTKVEQLSGQWGGPSPG